MKLVKFALIHCAAISVFLLASSSAQAGNVTFEWIGPETGGVWSDKENWKTSSAPYPIPQNKNSSDYVNFNGSVTVTIDMPVTITQLKVNAGDVTFLGGENGTNDVVVCQNAHNAFGEGASLTLDGAAMKCNQLAYPANFKLYLKNGALYLNSAGNPTMAANTLIDVDSGSVFDISCPGRAYSLHTVQAGCTIRIHGGSVFDATGGQFLNLMDPFSFIVEDGSKAIMGGIHNGGNYGPRGHCLFAIRGGSTLECNGNLSFHQHGTNTLEVTGGSTVNITGESKFGQESVISNDNSRIVMGGNLFFCQTTGDTGGDTVWFSGDNPVLRVTGSKIELQNNAKVGPKGVTLNYVVPKLGYVEAPLQFTGANKLFGNPTSVKVDGVNEKFIHVNFMAESPAFDPEYEYATKTLLYSANAGLNKFAIFDFRTLGEGNRTATRYTLADGQTEATTAVSAAQLWLTAQNGAEDKPVKERTIVIDKSKGVADGVSLSSVVKKRFTLTSSISQLASVADGYSTVLKVLAGANPAALEVVGLQPVTEVGNFSVTWDASAYETTYYLSLTLETYDAGERLVYGESSKQVSGMTHDAATYTWRPVDGDWNGNWNDPAHWDDDSDGDCLGYPATSFNTAVFTNPVSSTITFNGPCRSGTFRPKPTFGAVLTFVKGTGEKADNKLTVDNAVEFSGTNVFDGVSVKFLGGASTGAAGSETTFCNASEVASGFSTKSLNAWFRFVDGTQVSGGNIVLGNNGDSTGGGVLISNATVQATNLQLNYSGAAQGPLYGTLKFAGDHPLMTVAGTSEGSIYTIKHGRSESTIEFEIPEGGYANVPLQVGTGFAKPAFTQFRSDFTEDINCNIVISRTSGAYIPWSPADLPLITAPKSFLTEKIHFEILPGAKFGNTFLYGDATDSPYGWQPVAEFDVQVKTPLSIGAHLRTPKRIGTLILVR